MKHKTKAPKITIRGERAIQSTNPLWVLSLQRGWIPAEPNARSRAARMDQHALWIYGVEAP